MCNRALWKLFLFNVRLYSTYCYLNWFLISHCKVVEYIILGQYVCIIYYRLVLPTVLNLYTSLSGILTF